MSKSAPNRLTDLAIGRKDLVSIDPALINIEPGHNLRQFSDPEVREHIDELKTSIRAIGVKEPLSVRWEAGVVYLVNGECRLRAVMELIKEKVELLSVPVVQVSGNNEADRLLHSIVSNDGRPFSKMELGEGFRRLMAYGWGIDKISNHVGRQKRFVSDAIELCEAPQDVKEMVQAKEVTPALAVSHVRKFGGTKAKDTLREEATKARAKGHATAKRSKEKSPAEKAVARVLGELDLKELMDTSFDHLSVSRKALLALYKASGTKKA